MIKTLADLQTVHQITHRDIKPSNFLMKREGELDRDSHIPESFGDDLTNCKFLIADFGEAKKYTFENLTMNPTMLIGTVDFMAPELRNNINNF